MSRMSKLHAYITESLRQFPGLPKEQLIAMVVLHFDIPDKTAEYHVNQYLDNKGNK